MKKIHDPNSGQKQLREGIAEFSGAIKSTLGPQGQTVIIASNNVQGGVLITKDGVDIANEISSPHPVKDIAMTIMKQAARRTALTAGDGTTTSVVLTEAIINKFDKFFDKETDSKIDLIRDIKILKDKVLTALDSMSVDVSFEFTKHIATISTNNDPELGQLVANAFVDVDYVSVEQSMDTITGFTKNTGLRIDKGWTHPGFITDFKKRTCELENPYILMYDRDIHDFQELIPLFEQVVSQQRPILIVGTFKPDALATLQLNVQKGMIHACAVEPPSHGYEKIELMQDIVDVIGGMLFNESNGDNARMIRLEDLGQAAKVTVTESMCIIESTEQSSERLQLKLEQLREIKENNPNDKAIERRLERISNGFSIIKVGSPSNIETKEKMARVIDAVCAVRSAKEEGVLPGGGKSLYTALQLTDETKDTKAFQIMESAFMVPLIQMLDNSGIVDEVTDIANKVFHNPDNNFGYNIKTREFGDLIKQGVMDPTKVTKQALENAVSVATTILTTACVITDIKE